MDKNYKFIIVLLLFLISLYSCDKDVSTKDMIGVWECTDEQNRYFVLLPNDSCIIINYPELEYIPHPLRNNVLCARWELWPSRSYDHYSEVSFFLGHGGLGSVYIEYCPFCSHFNLFTAGVDDRPVWRYLRVSDTIPRDVDAFIKDHDRSSLHNCWLH